MHKGIATALAAAALALGGGALYAEEQLPTEDDYAGTSGEIELTVCGQGLIKECGSVTQQRCNQWVVTSITGGGEIGTTGGSINGSATMTCSSWTTTITKLYKDKYKQKST